MKKVIYWIVLIFLIYSFYHTFSLHKNGSNIPVFRYKNYSTDSVLTTKLPFKKTLFIFFTTECGSCDDVGSSIFEFSKTNKDFNYVFVTEETNRNKISNYIERNKISAISDYFFIDEEKSFQKDFGLGLSMSIPTILYYDEKGSFIKEIKNLNELSEIERFKK